MKIRLVLFLACVTALCAASCTFEDKQEALAQTERVVTDLQTQIATIEQRLENEPPSEQREDLEKMLAALQGYLTQTQQYVEALKSATPENPIPPEFLGLLPPEIAAWLGIGTTVLTAFRSWQNRQAGRNIAKSVDKAIKTLPTDAQEEFKAKIGAQTPAAERIVDEAQGKKTFIIPV